MSTVTICEVDVNKVWTGISKEIPDTKGAPKGWVFASPPTLAEDEVAQWTGTSWSAHVGYPDTESGFSSYKEEILAGVERVVSSTAQLYGFSSIEQAIKSYRENGQHRHYAQLIKEWSDVEYRKTREHLQYLESVPNDFSFLDTIEAFDPNRVPARVTMRQARSALLHQSVLPSDDKLAQIDAYLADTGNFEGELQQRQAQIDWNYSQAVERTASFVAEVGAALGFSDTDLDNLFRYAITLRA